jgi:hypothetical protein
MVFSFEGEVFECKSDSFILLELPNPASEPRTPWLSLVVGPDFAFREVMAEAEQSNCDFSRDMLKDIQINHRLRLFEDVRFSKVQFDYYVDVTGDQLCTHGIEMNPARTKTRFALNRRVYRLDLTESPEGKYTYRCYVT